MLDSLREKLDDYHYTEALTLDKNIVVVVTQITMIDDNLE